MAEDGGGGAEEVERLRQENAELTQQSEQLQALLKDVSADLGEEVHSMSMSMSAAGGAGMLREIEALEEVEQLRSEKAAMEVVMKQMAIELDDERRKEGAPQPAGSPSSPSAAAREAEVVLLRRQLQEERLARRAAARAAQQTEERLQLRVEELEAMLGEAICDVIDASQINQTAWGDEDAPCPDGTQHRHQTAPIFLPTSCPHALTSALHGLCRADSLGFAPSAIGGSPLSRVAPEEDGSIADGSFVDIVGATPTSAPPSGRKPFGAVGADLTVRAAPAPPPFDTNLICAGSAPAPHGRSGARAGPACYCERC